MTSSSKSPRWFSVHGTDAESPTAIGSLLSTLHKTQVGSRSADRYAGTVRIEQRPQFVNNKCDQTPQNHSTMWFNFAPRQDILCGSDVRSNIARIGVVNSGGDRYAALFDLRRFKKLGPNAVHLMVQSAYVLDPDKPSPGSGRIHFHALLGHALRGTIPRRPP